MAGTSVSWYGMVPNGTANTFPFATYSIDGGSPVPFRLTPDSQVTGFNQMLFTTPYFSPSEHSLIVTYLGNSTNTGLMLNYMYLMNVTIPSSSGSVTYKGSPTSTAGPASSFSSSASSGSPLRLRLGLGVVFGVIFLSALILSFLHRRRKKRQESSKRTQAPAPTGEVFPFLLGNPIVPTSLQSTLLAPFSKPRRTNSASPYPNSSDQLVGSSPNFGRYHVKNAASSSVTDSPDADAGADSLGNTSAHRGWAAPAQVRNGGSPTVVVQRHQDSGLRIRPDVLRVDIPPDYTAS